jgi:hypothetical protein
MRWLWDPHIQKGGSNGRGLGLMGENKALRELQALSGGERHKPHWPFALKPSTLSLLDEVWNNWMVSCVSHQDSMYVSVLELDFEAQEKVMLEAQ